MSRQTLLWQRATPKQQRGSFLIESVSDPPRPRASLYGLKHHEQAKKAILATPFIFTRGRVFEAHRWN